MLFARDICYESLLVNANFTHNYFDCKQLVKQRVVKQIESNNFKDTTPAL